MQTFFTDPGVNPSICEQLSGGGGKWLNERQRLWKKLKRGD